MTRPHTRHRGRPACLAGWLVVLTLLLTQLVLPATAFAQDDGPAPDSTGEVAPAATEDANLVTTTVTITASKDTYIASNFANTNFASLNTMKLGWNNNEGAMRIMMQFDLSSIPKNAVINSARYYIFQSSVIPPGDGNMDFRAQLVTQDWSESGVTWNNANYLGGASEGIGSIPNSFGYVSGDATNAVRAWVSGQEPNHGVIVTGDETPSRNRSRVFSTREVGGQAPYLQINYTANCDTVPPTATVEPLPQWSPGGFRVYWKGQDFAPSGCQPSGIANYDVQYRINGNDWVDWKKRTEATDQFFKNYAPSNAFVEFRARATDRAGNIGAWTGPQASTRIDSEPPNASMNPLPDFTINSNFTVSWGGTDSGSGIANYDVEFQVLESEVDEGNWQFLLEGTNLTSYFVSGAQNGTVWAFRARATDNVGNVQPWPAEAQAITLVFFKPVAVVLPIVPPIIQSTAPVTDSIQLNWFGFTAPGTNITSYDIYYRYMSYESGIPSRDWQVWQNFQGTTTEAAFPFKALGMGDGFYEFEAVATNSTGEKGDFNDISDAAVLVDLADKFTEGAKLPYAARQGAPGEE